MLITIKAARNIAKRHNSLQPTYLPAQSSKVPKSSNRKTKEPTQRTADFLQTKQNLSGVKTADWNAATRTGIGARLINIWKVIFRGWDGNGGEKRQEQILGFLDLIQYWHYQIERWKNKETWRKT